MSTGANDINQDRSYVAIIQYNAGNVQSVQYALQRLGAQAIITDDPLLIKAADKVIFPGVGHAAPAMSYLQQRGIDEVIKSLTQPVLGICLGQQLMCQYSEEGDTTCLGIFNEQVRLFLPEADTDGSRMKVPHVGWNAIYDLTSDLFTGLPQHSYVYSVHSYYAALGKDTIATTDYILPFSAALQRDNFYAVQFHPEKSGAVGEQILQNFINL